MDTNVAVVANARGNAPPACALACVRFLLDLTSRGGVVIDVAGAILDEYARHLSYAGQPGTGDQFFKWLHDNQWNEELCQRVTLTPRADDPEDYEEFPREPPELETFDRDDRKFVAAAVAAGPACRVAEATDTDWWDLRSQLESAGVLIEFLCEDYIGEIAAAKA